MRILLSGATGQLGRALHGSLTRLGEVSAPARAAFDLAEAESVRRALDALRPDLIVNAAAYTAVDQAEEERSTAQQINARAPAIMAEWAAGHGSAILHYSTDYVFDGNGRTPWKESDPTDPVNAYGATKRAGEIAIAESGTAHLIIRTSWLYDAQGANFARTILRLARERSELRIIDDQIGAPTPAWWLAETSIRILQRFGGEQRFEGRCGGLLHAAPEGTTSWYGFATAIIEGARDRAMPLSVEEIVPIPTSAYPTPAARPEFSVFDLSRLRTEFEISPPHWRDALAPVLDDIAGQALRP